MTRISNSDILKFHSKLGKYKMKIEENYCIELLIEIRDYYPHNLCSDGYEKLLNVTTEDRLDGHICYLWEHGYIHTNMEYKYKDAFDPKRNEGGWLIQSDFTRISAAGLDYLESIGK